MDLTKRDEEILENKIQDVFDNHFDEIPYYKDMEFTTDVNFKNIFDKVQTKPKRPYRGLKIASVIVAIIICSSAFSIIITNGSVEAGKDKIWNFINSLRGDEHKITDQPYSLEINDINDEDSIQKAKDIFPDLVVTNEMLNGFIFDYMTIDKIDKNNIFVTAIYYKDEKSLTFNQSKLDDNGSSIGIEDAYKELDINDGVMLLSKNVNSETGINSATYVKGNLFFEIIGEVDIDTLEKYMKSTIIPLL